MYITEDGHQFLLKISPKFNETSFFFIDGADPQAVQPCSEAEAMAHLDHLVADNKIVLDGETIYFV